VGKSGMPSISSKQFIKVGPVRFKMAYSFFNKKLQRLGNDMQLSSRDIRILVNRAVI